MSQKILQIHPAVALSDLPKGDTVSLNGHSCAAASGRMRRRYWICLAGAVGGILFPLLVGRMLDHYKLLGNTTAGYNLLFVFCGCAYLLAWGIMHLFTPKIEKVEIYSTVPKKTPAAL